MSSTFAHRFPEGFFQRTSTYSICFKLVPSIFAILKRFCSFSSSVGSSGDLNNEEQPQRIWVLFSVHKIISLPGEYFSLCTFVTSTDTIPKRLCMLFILRNFTNAIPALIFL